MAYWQAIRAVPTGNTGLAFAGLPDPQALGELSLLGVPAAVSTCSEDDFDQLLAEHEERSGQTAASLVAEFVGDLSADELPEHDLVELANQAPVVRLVNLLLCEALKAGASDVHLEASATGLTVRYRVDGVLREAPAPPGALRAAVVSRLKIMAELDIAERRVPQDGRIRLRQDGREIDVRVSTVPTLHGESVVLRLLGGDARQHALGDLGMSEETLSMLRESLSRTQGVVLATGPTGSGKTTTLYAALLELRSGREKIITIEDPVEYELAGVAQIPVRDSLGLGFATALRSILRQDPDVILVGEMRDAETADICVQAALTGHLVLSTLHTRDAPGALIRLINLGVPSYLVAATLDAVLAQRLVRRVCPACASSTKPVKADLITASALGIDLGNITRGDGCGSCLGTGYCGRTGLYELLLVDDPIRARLGDRPDVGELRSLASKQGMRTLAADGWRQVASGVTTPEEVRRVTDG